MLFKKLIHISFSPQIRTIASLFELPETHIHFQDKCRKFVAEVLVPVASEIDHKQTFPRELLTKMGKVGLMGINVPEKFGGSGLDCLALVIGVEEISRGLSMIKYFSCANSGMVMGIHNTFYLQTLLKWGTQQQIERFVKPFTTGENIGCFALAEPAHGSRLTSPNTNAQPNDKISAMVCHNFCIFEGLVCMENRNCEIARSL